MKANNHNIPDNFRVLEPTESVFSTDLCETLMGDGFVRVPKSRIGNSAGNTGRVIRRSVPGDRDISDLRIAPVESLSDKECRALRVHLHCGDLRLTDDRIAARIAYYDNRIAVMYGLSALLTGEALMTVIERADTVKECE